MSTTTTTTTNGTSDGTTPKITFYTNHGCPWAQRTQITLKALNLPYEEIVIPLDRPREQWYLDINPRGLVPAIKISNGDLKDEIIAESGIVSTFLADAFPDSTFWPKSDGPASALRRARIMFFVETWFGKVNSLLIPLLKAEGEEAERIGREFVGKVQGEIEPLLAEANPFFGGSKSITLAEALTASFILRLPLLSEAGLLPSSMLKSLKALPNFGRWMDAVCADEHVNFKFDGESVAKGTRERVEGMKKVGGK